jgi:N utilization substance protein B
MTRRRRARIVALDVLYAVEHGRNDWAAVLSETVSKSKLDSEASAFSKRLVETTLAHQREIDRLLASASEKWTVQRMAAMDRSTLRLGIAQICFMVDIPPKVAINESVELAKAFGGPDSPAFVNGVLDNVARTCRPKSAQAPNHKSQVSEKLQ